MDVCADDFGNAPCEEVPDDDAAVVAAHRQKGAPAVEGAGQGHADTVQSAICLLTTHNHINNEPFHCKNINQDFYQAHVCWWFTSG